MPAIMHKTAAIGRAIHNVYFVAFVIPTTHPKRKIERFALSNKNTNDGFVPEPDSLQPVFGVLES